MYSFFILPCFMIFFIIYGLNAKKEGKRVYRVIPVFFVFCFSVIVSAFLFSIVNQAFNMEWVKSPGDFFREQLMFALGPLIGFSAGTILRGDWRKEKKKQEEEIEKREIDWTGRLKRLPNTKKGACSALCDVVLVSVALAIYFAAKTMGIKLGKHALTALVVSAKILATPFFFAWVRFAKQLKKEPGTKNG